MKISGTQKRAGAIAALRAQFVAAAASSPAPGDSRALRVFRQAQAQQGQQGQRKPLPAYPLQQRSPQ